MRRDQAIAVVVDVANVHLALCRHLSFPTMHLDQLLDAMFRHIAQCVPPIEAPQDWEAEPLSLATVRCVEICAVDGQPEDELKGSASTRSIHQRLREMGCRLELLPNKRRPDHIRQGGVDVKLGIEILRVGRVFPGGQTPVDHVLVLSGDVDLQPAVEALLEAAPYTHVWVTGLTMYRRGDTQGVSISWAYVKWLRSTPRAHFIPLEAAAGRCSAALQPEVLHLPKCHGLAPGQWAAAATGAIETCEKDDVRVQNSRDPTMSCYHLHALANALWDAGGWRVAHLWLDHNPQMDDSWVPAISLLIDAAPRLQEIHISDSSLTLRGLEALILDAVTRPLWFVAPAASRANGLYLNLTQTPAGDCLEDWVDRQERGPAPPPPFASPAFVGVRPRGNKVRVAVRTAAGIRVLTLRVSSDTREQRARRPYPS